MIRAIALSATMAFILPAQTAEQIVKLHTQALGGTEAFSKIKTLRMTGKVIAGAGMEMPMTIEIKKPSTLRVDVSAMGKNIIQVVNGKESWMVNPMMGSEDPTPMPAEMAEQAESQASRFRGILVDYKEQGYTLELMGKEKLNGADVFKLKLVDKKGEASFLFLDADSYLISQTTRKIKAMGQELSTTVKFGDYKAVSGMMFVHTIDVQIEGMPMANQRVIMDKVEVNIPLDESRFVMPKKATPAEAPATKAPEAKTSKP